MYDNQPLCDTACIRNVKNNLKIAQINVEGLTQKKAKISKERFGEMDVPIGVTRDPHTRCRNRPSKNKRLQLGASHWSK